MAEDRQTFEAHIAELHRCITCPIDDEERARAIQRVRAADLAQEDAQEPQENASSAVELWPGTTTPRNQPIWPGIGYSTGSDWKNIITAAAMSAGASRSMQKRRDEGTDNTVFKGMSMKSEERNRVMLPARIKAKKKSSR